MGRVLGIILFLGLNATQSAPGQISGTFVNDLRETQAAEGKNRIQGWLTEVQQLENRYEELAENFKSRSDQASNSLKHNNSKSTIMISGQARIVFDLVNKERSARSAVAFLAQCEKRLIAPRADRTGLGGVWSALTLGDDGSITFDSFPIASNGNEFVLGTNRIPMVEKDGTYHVSLDGKSSSFELVFSQVNSECLAGYVNAKNRETGTDGKARLFLLRADRELETAVQHQLR